MVRLSEQLLWAHYGRSRCRRWKSIQHIRDTIGVIVCITLPPEAQRNSMMQLRSGAPNAVLVASSTSTYMYIHGMTASKPVGSQLGFGRCSTMRPWHACNMRASEQLRLSTTLTCCDNGTPTAAKAVPASSLMIRESNACANRAASDTLRRKCGLAVR
jgi:hypothetical protein